jgi:(4-(4-[2-(gamma-L-glutamylamino)ethyl]phenoxymethyl)furan-2-yl)methanamine synthase
MTPPAAVLGWDIGGVNTKVSRLEGGRDDPTLRSVCVPYEIKRDPGALVGTLIETAQRVGSGPGDLHAVTMTAELSQAFRTKREGIGVILDAFEAAFPGSNLHVYRVNGGFVAPSEARNLPLAVSAANWSATARVVARSTPNCVLIDIGTTSTDITPIVNGGIVVQGHTDPERLLSGELVYTGALRTPVEAVAHTVPLWGGRAGVAADGFSIIGDVHLWLRRLGAEDYTCPTPDGRPATREAAAERLARVVCADLEILDEAALNDIAHAVAGAQRQTVVDSLERVLKRWPVIGAAVVTGLGDFIALEAAAALGLEIISPGAELKQSARNAPSAAVAWLLWYSLESAA